MKEQLVKSTAQIYDGVNACTSITVHETDNSSLGADAQAHAKLQTDGNVRQASWHIQVDDVEAIRSYPDAAQCWHAGTDEGNRTSIAVEICVNADGDYDKAFKNAAAVIADLRATHGLPRSAVVQHGVWTGKNCPARMRLAGRWDEFTKLTDPKENPMSKMVSPFEGRLTQNHGDAGGYRGHKGMDIAPPKPGQTGRPVYAAFAGTWKKIIRGVRHGSLSSTWAPGRTGGGGLVANPDGEGNGYNHVDVLDHWKVGQWINAGDLIGYNDTSGNQSGPHLHFELWADWRNPNSDYDPQLAFTKFKVKPGSAPAIILKPAIGSKPVAQQSAKNPPNGSTIFPKNYAKLAVDGDFESLSVGALQILLHAAGYRHNKQWDGVLAKLGWMDVQEWLAATGFLDAKKWKIDGKPETETIKALQRMLVARGRLDPKKWAIDGKFQAETKKALQRHLNANN